jgi:hypothetical protein
MNTFHILDRVKTSGKNTVGVPGATVRLNGKVKYIACQLATKAGGKTCDKDNCNHPIKDYVWVLWPMTTKTMSYHYSELDFEPGYGPIAGNARTVLPAAKDMKVAPLTIKDAALEKMKEKVSDILKPEPEFDFHKYNFGRIKSSKASDIERKPLSNEELTPEFWRKYTGVGWL